MILPTLLIWMLAVVGNQRANAEMELSPFAAPSDFATRVGLPLYFTSSNCCGLVAAYMVVHDLGRPIDLKTMAAQLPVRRSGTSMLELVQYLRSLGFEAEALDLSADKVRDALKTDPRLRAIAFMKPNHWVAVLPHSSNDVNLYMYPQWIRQDFTSFSQVYSGKTILVCTKFDGPVGGMIRTLAIWSLLGVLALGMYTVNRLINSNLRRIA